MREAEWLLAQLAEHCLTQGARCLLVVDRELERETLLAVLGSVRFDDSKGGAVEFRNGSRINIGRGDLESFLGIEYDYIAVVNSAKRSNREIRDCKCCLRTSKPGIVPAYYDASNPGAWKYADIRGARRRLKALDRLLTPPWLTQRRLKIGLAIVVALVLAFSAGYLCSSRVDRNRYRLESGKQTIQFGDNLGHRGFVGVPQPVFDAPDHVQVLGGFARSLIGMGHRPFERLESLPSGQDLELCEFDTSDFRQESHARIYREEVI